MPLTLFPGTDQYTTVTVSGLYDNNTESPLFAANGTAAPTSGILVGSVDSNGNFQPLSSTPNGFLNVNATFSGTTTVQGTLSNNTAAPIADNLGTLGFLASTSYTTNTYTNGFQVLATTDLHGAINDDLQAVAGVQLGATAVVAFGSTPAAVNVPAVNSSIFSGTTALTNTAGSLNVNVTNTVPVTISGQPITVKGEYTNNTTATSTITDNFSVLPATAATAYNTFTWTNGNQVVLVTDLHGAINNDMQASAGVQLGATAVTAFGTAPAAANVIGANVSLFAGTTGITATGTSVNVNVTGGTVTVTQGTTPWVVAGNLTNNNAAPTNNNVGALIAVTNSGTFPAVTLPAYTAGDQELLRVSQGGSLVTIPADEEYAASISYYADDSGFTTLITLPNATLVPLISIQSNSAAFSFLIREVQGYGDGSQVKFVLIKNPQTLTGAAFTATGIPTGSHIKRDVTATAVTIGTGTVVWSAMGASAPVHTDMLLQWLNDGTPGDTYTLAAQKFGTGTSKAFGSIRWSEEAAAV
jgi:hypothetical protein